MAAAAADRARVLFTLGLQHRILAERMLATTKIHGAPQPARHQDWGAAVWVTRR